MRTEGHIESIALPLETITLKQRVVQVIKEAILARRLSPGDRIVELKLAQQLNIGTTAVREALFELERLGFVTRITNKATYVTRLAPDDVRQIFLIRRNLEGLAAELVETRANGEDIDRLEDLINQMRSAPDLSTFYRVDLEFHRTLWVLSGNSHLVRVLEGLVVPLFAFFLMRNSQDSKDALLLSCARHQELINALREGRPARSCMENMIQFFTQQQQSMLFGNDQEIPNSKE